MSCSLYSILFLYDVTPSLTEWLPEALTTVRIYFVYIAMTLNLFLVFSQSVWPFVRMISSLLLNLEEKEEMRGKTSITGYFLFARIWWPTYTIHVGMCDLLRCLSKLCGGGIEQGKGERREKSSWSSSNKGLKGWRTSVNSLKG